MCKRFFYSPSKDSPDSLREGRPRAAEVESPNQNRAIYTSQMDLATLIN